MLRLSTICVFAFLPLSLFAQQKQRVDINQVSVFLRGAELTSTAKVNLPKGETEILFTNVAGNILQQSLTVGADNGVLVQSATFQNDYLSPETTTPRTQMIEDSLEILNENLLLLNDKRIVLDEQIAVLRENRKVTGDEKSLPVAELQKLLDLVNNKLTGLLTEKHSIANKLTKTNERIALLNRQLEEEEKKDNLPGGKILVKFYSDKPTNSSIEMSYVVSEAGWTPTYDLRVEKINAPVRLFYKANIFQNTGVKWDNVKLVLSTGNPNEGVDAPTLNPWTLAFYQQTINPYLGSTTLTRENIKNLPNRNTSDMAALTPGLYQSKSADNINIGGSRQEGTLYIIDGAEVKGIDQHVQVDNSGVNTSFDVDLPYTIPSDGQQHLVAIKEYELPASYRYFAVPKLDRDAFLQARITHWESLNLLPAKTNVFYEGTYVGQGFIDMRNVKDTMNISLGRDKKVIIRREKDKDYRAAKTFGSNLRQSYAYTISVRNTRQEPIDLMLLDQFPVSNDKDIVIEETAAEDGNIDEMTGSIKWILNIKPSELKKLKLFYTVKYPKEKTINNLY